jgi:hypothetical protein
MRSEPVSSWTSIGSIGQKGSITARLWCSIRSPSTWPINFDSYVFLSHPLFSGRRTFLTHVLCLITHYRTFETEMKHQKDSKLSQPSWLSTRSLLFLTYPPVFSQIEAHLSIWLTYHKQYTPILERSTKYSTLANSFTPLRRSPRFSASTSKSFQQNHLSRLLRIHQFQWIWGHQK